MDHKLHYFKVKHKRKGKRLLMQPYLLGPSRCRLSPDVPPPTPSLVEVVNKYNTNIKPGPDELPKLFLIHCNPLFVYLTSPLRYQFQC